MFLFISAVIVASIIALIILSNTNPIFGRRRTHNSNNSTLVPNPPDFSGVKEPDQELVGDYKFFGNNNSLNGTSVVDQSDIMGYKKNMTK